MGDVDIELKDLPDDIDELKRIIASQNTLLKERDTELKDKSKLLERNTDILRNNSIEIKILKEKVSLLQSRLFSKRSEKMGPIEQTQSVLFNEIEVLHDSDPELSLDEESVTIPAHQRSKKRKKRIPDDLERRDEVIDVPESEKVCGCGAMKSRIGEEVSEKIDYIPADVFVRRIVRPKYACRKCYGSEDEGQPVTIAPAKPTLLGKSILSEGIFGHMIVSKFADSLPFYRQEVIFRRAGVEISRKTMATSAIRVAESLEVLQNLLYQEILKAPVIGIDETRFQVLKEPGRRADQLSFLWHILAYTRDGPVPIYLYRSDRSAKFLKEFLSGFNGAIVTDGYSSYNFFDSMDGIVHAGCNAHARRKFVEADKVAKGNPDIHAILDLYKRIYKIESEWKKSEGGLSEMLELRHKVSKPLMEELKSLLDNLSIAVNPSGQFGNAVSYTRNEWGRLTAFLENPEIPIDNNRVENGIRPFVVGRKNWLFADTVSGAHSSTLFYSLIEGAKAAGLNPALYMSHLLQKAPYAISENDWRALLPVNLKDRDWSIID
jgi:transposase